jgi:hypothetical protein
MVNIDSETVFNVGAGVLATVAALFFLVNVDLGQSPVTTWLVVIAFIAGVFAVTQRADDRQVTAVGYGVAVVTGVGLLFELVSTFEVGDIAIVLGLLVLAAVLFALRTRLDDHAHLVGGRRATVVFGALAALAAVVIVADVATGAVAYELQPESEIQVSEERHDEIRVATLVASNPSPLPQRVEAPRYGACAASDWSEYRPSEPDGPEEEVRVNLRVDDGYDEHVMSFSTRRFPATLYVGAQNVSGETFPVRMTEECPEESTGEPYVAVYEVPEPNGRPV